MVTEARKRANAKWDKENSDQSGAGHEFDGWSDEELRGAVHLMEDLSDEEFNAIMDAYNRKKRR